MPNNKSFTSTPKVNDNVNGKRKATCAFIAQVAFKTASGLSSLTRVWGARLPLCGADGIETVFSQVAYLLSHRANLPAPKLLYQKPQKSGLMLHRLIRIILILDVPTAPLVMHVCNLIHFLQSRLFALRTNREWVVSEVLKLLKLSQAIITMINVDWHFILPFCKRLRSCG